MRHAPRARRRWSGGPAAAAARVRRSLGDLSRGSWTVLEIEDKAQHVGVVFGRRWFAAGDPVQEIGVARFEQRFEAGELTVIERREIPLGERAEQKIGLAQAAMPAAEEQPLAPHVGTVRHAVL